MCEMQKSVYEEICDWIVDDYLECIDAGEGADIEAIIEQNLEDLSESIWSRRDEIEDEIKKRLGEMGE